MREREREREGRGRGLERRFPRRDFSWLIGRVTRACVQVSNTVKAADCKIFMARL